MNVFRKVYEYLTRPLDPAIQDPAERRQVKLFASLLLAMIAAGYVIEIITIFTNLARHHPYTDYVYTLIITSLLAGLYFLSRTRRFILVASLMILVISLAIFGMASFVDKTFEPDMYYFIVIPLLLCSYFFSYKTTFWLGLVYTIVMVAITMTQSPDRLNEVIGGHMPFSVAMTGLITVLTRYRILGEAERQRSLEEQVADRTHALKQANQALEWEIETRKEIEKLQNALYHISEAVHSAHHADEFFPIIHQIVADLTPARNFYIAYYDEATDIISFPYYVDEKDETPPPGKLGDSVTGYVVRSGEALLVTPQNKADLAKKPGIRFYGTASENWLGVPLKTTNGKTIGILAVQNYPGAETDGIAYTMQDREMLSFVSAQIAMAIEHHRAQVALAESESRFRIVSELASDYAYSYWVDEQGEPHMEWVTDAVIRIADLSPAEIIAKGGFIASIVHPDDLHIVRAHVKTLLENRPDTTEHRIVTRRGEIRLVRHISLPIWDEDEKRVVRIIGAAQDVTEQRRVEEQIRQTRDELERRVIERTAELAQTNQVLREEINERELAEQALQRSYRENKQLLSAILSILIGVGPDQRVTHWNEAAVEALGIRNEEAIDQPFFTMTVDWDWQVIRESVQACSITRQPIRTSDVRLKRPDGDTRILGLTIMPLGFSERGESGFLLLGSDVTERRSMESQLAQTHKLESIGQLAAGIAHELNTPAQFVNGNLRFLRDHFPTLLKVLEKLDAVKAAAAEHDSVSGDLLYEADKASKTARLDYLIQEYPRAIDQSIEGIGRITNIVSAMREFSHPGTGHRSLTNINRALDSTLQVARNEWKYVAEVTTDFDPNLPNVECLAAELNQAFLNIIINAVHAIGDVVSDGSQGKGLITITTRGQEDWVEIRISDTGGGIPDDIRGRIFDPFFTTKEVGKGTGQGLAITHNIIVNKHGGSISFESEVGYGTTFIIRLPIQGTIAH